MKTSSNHDEDNWLIRSPDASRRRASGGGANTDKCHWINGIEKHDHGAFHSMGISLKFRWKFLWDIRSSMEILEDFDRET